MRSLIILLALTTTALAQQRPAMQPQPSVVDQALSQKLLEEINSCIQLRTQLITAQERIKQLEEASKPKDDKK